jgi:O-antigen/teichoic acid export membrane protein
MAANVLALVGTIAFARALGTSGYGELARMISVFTILLVPGSALQAAVARETALGGLGSTEAIAATLQSWRQRIVLLAAALTVVCLILRQPLANLMQVHQEWAAALVLPTGVLWVCIALQRGVLLGLADYRPVGWSLVAEQTFRLGFGLAAVVIGLSVTGIFIASLPLAFFPITFALAWETKRRLGVPDNMPLRTPLRTLARRNPVPVAALTLFAVVQNADVVAVGHFFNAQESGAYAQAAVAAKGIIWLAVGLGLYVLPEATREAAKGLDPRHLLFRGLGLLSIVAIPLLLIYTFFASTVLNLVFGDKADLAASALPAMGAAMTLLAVSFLAVQFALALGRRAFVWLIAAAAIAVPIFVGLADESLEDVALAMLVLNVIFVICMMIVALRPNKNANAISEADAEEMAAAGSAMAAEAIP